MSDKRIPPQAVVETKWHPKRTGRGRKRNKQVAKLRAKRRIDKLKYIRPDSS